MTEIKLHTTINAPIETVFDLSRSIDFHLKSAAKTKEKAIAGRTSGLINYGETVTWRGRHFGLFLRHTSKITTFERPVNFTDTMIEGHFTYFIHQHNFRATNEVELERIYDYIDKLEKTEIDVTVIKRHSEMFHPFAFIALILILLEVLLRQTILRSLP